MGRAFLAVACAMCASPAASSPSRLDSVVIDGVTHVRQKPDFCGEADVEMWARHEGLHYDQDDVFGQTGLDPALGRGAYTPDLVRAVKRLGFEPPNVYTMVDASRPQDGLERELTALHADLKRGVPSIVCMHYDDQPHTTEHFRLVVGYDAAKDEIIYQEPAEDRGGYRHMKRAMFEKLWPLPSSDAHKRVLVRIPLVKGKLVEPARPHGFTPADYAQHVMALRDRLGDKLGRISVRVEEPFVVIGDAGDTVLARDAKTVRWAADHLEKDLFAVRPQKILDVYLFHDAASYERGVKTLTGSAPDTPYGFYSASHAGLFMNIATGGGTLVHEIVHPYVEADFPGAPPWLNEGLGSLFEQSAERDGHIVGLTNWRLDGLQRALAHGNAPSFSTLAHMPSAEFYGGGSGANYATARYLLFYLQQQGKLQAFYKAFRAARGKDPSGYTTLVATLGEADMDDFRTRWEKFVTALRFSG